MHKIALVQGVGLSDEDDFCQSSLSNLIGEWEEVDDALFNDLKDASNYMSSKYGVRLLEQVSVTDRFVINSLKAFKDEVTAYKLAQAKAEEQRKEKKKAALERKLQREAKTRKELFEKLKSEFE
jgi:hypothetical protein